MDQVFPDKFDLNEELLKNINFGREKKKQKTIFGPSQ
jgi:hypothetical protein